MVAYRIKFSYDPYKAGDSANLHVQKQSKISLLNLTLSYPHER